MLLSKERLIYLLKVYSNGAANEFEEQELFAWVNANDSHEFLVEFIQTLIRRDNAGEKIPPVDWDHLYNDILRKSVLQKKSAGTHKLFWLRSIAAAAILLLLVAGGYFMLNKKQVQPSLAAVPPVAPIATDVAAPTSGKAILTLGDGQKIDLDSIGTGTLAQQGAVKVVRHADGKITYTGTSTELLYNTLTVPRGSQVVTIRLADNTQVWLNSESTLRYPASFQGAERKVEISGEAYFEVAHNPLVPFIVKKDGMEIKVLGTRFNINAYDDEKINKLTLLEGSVRVSMNQQQQLMKPGQQAQVSDQVKLVNGVNIEEVMAWKNGLFQFGEKADLQQIMRKIARWYDVDVNYDGAPADQHFGGEIPMNSNLSQVLEILRTSGVKFTIEGKKVMVRP